MDPNTVGQDPVTGETAQQASLFGKNSGEGQYVFGGNVAVTAQNPPVTFGGLNVQPNNIPGAVAGPTTGLTFGGAPAAGAPVQFAAATSAAPITGGPNVAPNFFTKPSDFVGGAVPSIATAAGGPNVPSNFFTKPSDYVGGAATAIPNLSMAGVPNPLATGTNVVDISNKTNRPVRNVGASDLLGKTQSEILAQFMPQAAAQQQQQQQAMAAQQQQQQQQQAMAAQQQQQAAAMAAEQQRAPPGAGQMDLEDNAGRLVDVLRDTSVAIDNYRNTAKKRRLESQSELTDEDKDYLDKWSTEPSIKAYVDQAAAYGVEAREARTELARVKKQLDDLKAEFTAATNVNAQSIAAYQQEIANLTAQIKASGAVAEDAASLRARLEQAQQNVFALRSNAFHLSAVAMQQFAAIMLDFNQRAIKGTQWNAQDVKNWVKKQQSWKIVRYYAQTAAVFVSFDTQGKPDLQLNDAMVRYALAFGVAIIHPLKFLRDDMEAQAMGIKKVQDVVINVFPVDNRPPEIVEAINNIANAYRSIVASSESINSIISACEKSRTSFNPVQILELFFSNTELANIRNSIVYLWMARYTFYTSQSVGATVFGTYNTVLTRIMCISLDKTKWVTTNSGGILMPRNVAAVYCNVLVMHLLYYSIIATTKNAGKNIHEQIMDILIDGSGYPLPATDQEFFDRIIPNAGAYNPAYLDGRQLIMGTAENMSDLQKISMVIKTYPVSPFATVEIENSLVMTTASKYNGATFVPQDFVSVRPS